MKALIETFYKEENLRFLPEDIQAKGVTSLAQLAVRHSTDLRMHSFLTRGVSYSNRR